MLTFGHGRNRETVWMDFMLLYLRFLIVEYFYDTEKTDEEAEPTFSEDEALTQRGLRRSQSVKITRSRLRKDVRLLFLTHTFDIFYIAYSVYNLICLQARYGSLKIKGKKRPALSSVNYGMWAVTDTHSLFLKHTFTEECAGWMWFQHLLQLWIYILVNTFSLLIPVLYLLLWYH